MADPTPAELAESIAQLSTDLNNFWLCQGGAMVLLMGAGFLILEVSGAI